MEKLVLGFERPVNHTESLQDEEGGGGTEREKEEREIERVRGRERKGLREKD